MDTVTNKATFEKLHETAWYKDLMPYAYLFDMHVCVIRCLDREHLDYVNQVYGNHSGLFLSADNTLRHVMQGIGYVNGHEKASEIEKMQDFVFSKDRDYRNDFFKAINDSGTNPRYIVSGPSLEERTFLLSTYLRSKNYDAKSSKLDHTLTAISLAMKASLFSDLCRLGRKTDFTTAVTSDLLTNPSFVALTKLFTDDVDLDMSQFKLGRQKIFHKILDQLPRFEDEDIYRGIDQSPFGLKKTYEYLHTKMYETYGMEYFYKFLPFYKADANGDGPLSTESAGEPSIAHLPFDDEAVEENKNHLQKLLRRLLKNEKLCDTQLKGPVDLGIFAELNEDSVIPEEDPFDAKAILNVITSFASITNLLVHSKEVSKALWELQEKNDLTREDFQTFFQTVAKAREDFDNGQKEELAEELLEIEKLGWKELLHKLTPVPVLTSDYMLYVSRQKESSQN